MAKTYTPDKSYQFGENIIDFYEVRGAARHVYMKRGDEKRIKSVSGITKQLDKSDMLIPWAVKLTKTYLHDLLAGGMNIGADEIEEAGKQHRLVKEKAADKGTQVHEWCNKYIENKIARGKKKIAIPEDEQIMNGIIAFKKWEENHDVKFLATEKLVYSEKLNICGILDCVAIVDGKKSLVDFKTSNGVYPEYVLQVAGYRLISTECEDQEKFDGPDIILRFDKDTGEFHAFPIPINKKIDKAFECLVHVSNTVDEIKALLK